MITSRRWLFAESMCLALGASLVSGACSSSKPTATGTITLTLLHHNNPAFDTADQNAITAYEALHPEIHFVTQTGTFTDLGEELQTLLPTNSIDADIITIPPAQTCAFTKYLNPVPSDVMTTDQASALFFAAPLEGSTCGGQLMAIPIEYNMEYGGIVVNMDLYGGTTVPTWTNIDDMFTDVASHVLSAPADYCASATNPASCLRGTTGMSFLQADPLRNVFLAGILQRGGQIWSGSALNFASAEAQASIQWIWEKAWISMDNAAVHCSNSVDDVDPILSTTNQRDVSRYCGTWLIPAVQANYPNLNLAYTTHPPLVGTEHKFVTNAGWSYAVPKTSTHAAEAWDFIKYLTTNQAQALAWSKTTGTIPALSANANDPGLLASTAGLAAIVPLLPLGHWLGYLPDVNKVFTTIFYARLYPLFCNDPTGADPAYATDAQRQAAVAVVANQIQSDLNALGWW